MGLPTFLVSFLHQPWQLRWTLHIRLSTMPLVQQWTVKVHGWQGGYVNTQKWRAHTFVDIVRVWILQLVWEKREIESTYTHPYQYARERERGIIRIKGQQRENKQIGYYFWQILLYLLLQRNGGWESQYMYTVCTTNPWGVHPAYCENFHLYSPQNKGLSGKCCEAAVHALSQLPVISDVRTWVCMCA